MSLTPYFGGHDPFFGQLEKAMDRAFDRALGSRTGGDMTLFLPTLTGPSTASGHPMVSLFVCVQKRSVCMLVGG